MRYAIWDLETNSSDTFFGFILEAGGILVDENFKEIDRFNLRGHDRREDCKGFER